MNAMAPSSTLRRRLPPLTNQSEFAQKESTHDLNDAIIFTQLEKCERHQRAAK